MQLGQSCKAFCACVRTRTPLLADELHSCTVDVRCGHVQHQLALSVTRSHTKHPGASQADNKSKQAAGVGKQRWYCQHQVLPSYSYM